MGKKRPGLQIRFNPESEKDVIEYFSKLKKTEVHITAISAFRMYMRSVGFYDIVKINKPPIQSELPAEMNDTDTAGTGPVAESKPEEGIYDEEALEELGSMFDKENEVGKD